MRFFKKSNHIGYFWLWLSFLFVAIVVFGQILNNFFASDDFHWLVIAIDTSFDWQIFFSNYEGHHDGGSYNPFLVIIFKFFYNLFGLNYFAYHLLSIIIHASNAFLIFLLAKKIFQLVNIKCFKKFGLISGFLFLIYPIHVELISWIAAWPHLWTLFFCLLSFLYYFYFREQNKKLYIALSLLFFVLALFTKEIAISLPFVILLWEIYFSSQNKKFDKKLFYYLAIYFVLLILFFYLRYTSIGLLFGYYASSNLRFDYMAWSANIAAFWGDFFTFGFLRTIIYKFIYYYLDTVVILVFTLLAFYLFLILLKKKYLQFTIFGSWMIILVPVFVTGLHRTSFGGERYLYLASSFFVFWLIILLRDVGLGKKWNRYIMASFLILFLTINAHKLTIWDQASDISRQIVDSYQELNLEKGQKLLSVSLPDNLEGAEVFRNNLQQALELYYPDRYPNIYTTLAYLELDKENKNDHLLKWRRDDRGWFAESVDGSFVVTGITSISMNNFYWELWNYNYQNYKANIIRLIADEKARSDIKSGELKILVFDRGVLKILD